MVELKIAGENPGEAVITVKDQGHGITPEDQQHIFDRFYRVRNRETARTSGLGLGLFISHEIIEQHRGKNVAGKPAGQRHHFLCRPAPCGGVRRPAPRPELRFFLRYRTHPSYNRTGLTLSDPPQLYQAVSKPGYKSVAVRRESHPGRRRLGLDGQKRFAGRNLPQAGRFVLRAACQDFAVR